MMPDEPKILVVDDESSITVLCQHLLELNGYAVASASDPEDAFQILESQKVSLLLTDIRLPEMDGFELAEKALQMQPEMAVVVMTGYRTVETAIRALRSGVDGLIIKPYELGPELVEVVRQALESNQKKQSATSLPELEPLFRLSGAALVETPPQMMETLMLEALRDLLKVKTAGVYACGGPENAFRLLAGSGNIPGAEDSFWNDEAVLKACAGDPLGRMLATGGSAQPEDLLANHDWGSLLLVCLKRRGEQMLFLAARPADVPVFRRADLDFLTGFARQASVSLENARLFHRLAGFARKVEGQGGLFEDAQRMDLMEKLMPALIHEVNNPLHAVKNNLYLAGRGGQPADRLQSYLSTAQQELYRMEMVLQRLLTLAEPLCADRAPVDVEQLIAHTLDLFQTRLKDQNILVKLAAARPLPVVDGVRDELRLVLYCLLENAIAAQAGQEGEKIIWIDAATTENQVQITIEDSGAGVRESARENLFKPFTSLRTGSTGQGLAVSRGIIERQGGNLRAEAGRRGSGLRMVLDLPALREQREN